MGSKTFRFTLAGIHAYLEPTKFAYTAKTEHLDTWRKRD